MINIESKKGRRLYQLEFDRQLRVLENTYIRELTPLLNKQFKDAAEFVGHGLIDSTNYAVEKKYKEQVDLLKKHYKRVASVFGKKVFGHLEIKSVLYPETPWLEEWPQDYSVDYPEQLKTPMDDYWQEFDKWSQNEAASKIVGIQKTTKEKIRDIIDKGYREGESHSEIAKRISKTGTTINPYRAKVIARTETHGAAVRSVDSAVKSTRIQMEKEWVSAHDDRTRTRLRGDKFEHYAKFPVGPDGERVPQDQPFKGTGENLDYPGDSLHGSVGNLVNCRCTVIYHSVQKQLNVSEYTPDQNIFIPAKTVEEAKQKFKEIGLGELSIVDDYTEKEALKISNELTQHFYETFQKYPKLQNLLKDKKPVDDFYVFKGVFLPGTGNKTLGRYYKKQIWVGGEQYKNVHDLKIGKRTWTVGKDFFTNARHEFGHAIRENIFEEDMSYWYKLWDWHGDKVSKYGATNASEFFSESFAAYTSPKYKAGMLPKEIESFFDDLLGVKRKVGKVKPVEISIIGDEKATGKIKLGVNTVEEFDARGSLFYHKSSSGMHVGMDTNYAVKEVKYFDKEIDQLAARQSWTEEEVKIITSDSNKPHYEDINFVARERTLDKAPDYIKNAAKILDDKFDKNSEIKETLIMWRGENIIELREWKIGSIYKDNGYVMGTKSPLYALSATSERLVLDNTAPRYPIGLGISKEKINFNSSRRTLFQIEIPKGKRAIVPPTKNTAPGELLNTKKRMTNREAIVLLPRDSEFIITEVVDASEKTGGATIVKMRVK